MLEEKEELAKLEAQHRRARTARRAEGHELKTADEERAAGPRRSGRRRSRDLTRPREAAARTRRRASHGGRRVRGAAQAKLIKRARGEREEGTSRPRSRRESLEQKLARARAEARDRRAGDEASTCPARGAREGAREARAGGLRRRAARARSALSARARARPARAGAFQKASELTRACESSSGSRRAPKALQEARAEAGREGALASARSGSKAHGARARSSGARAERGGSSARAELERKDAREARAGARRRRGRRLASYRRVPRELDQRELDADKECERSGRAHGADGARDIRARSSWR